MTKQVYNWFKKMSVAVSAVRLSAETCGYDEGQIITPKKANLAVQQLKAAGFKVAVVKGIEAVIFFDKDKERGITFTYCDDDPYEMEGGDVKSFHPAYIAVHMWSDIDEHGEYPEADEVAARINEKLGRKAVKPADYIEWMDSSGVWCDRSKIDRVCRKIFGKKLYDAVMEDGEGMTNVLWYMIGMKNHGANVAAIKKTLAEEKKPKEMDATDRRLFRKLEAAALRKAA